MIATSGFGSGARLRERRQFRRLLREGRKTVGPSVILWSRLGRSETEPRLGLSVSSKLGGAVRRNRLKRLIREAFRLNRAGLAPGLELIAYPRPGCSWKGRADAEKELLELWRRTGLLLR